MPSPFPGMDPYLEARALWGSVHHRLISAISDALSALIAPHFFVGIEERVYIVSSEDVEGEVIFPDAYLVQHPQSGAALASASARPLTEPTLVAALAPVEVRDRYIEIRDARGQEVVTTIEVLSPRNKAPNSRGRHAFLKKRQAVLASRTNWIEIDLLRGGERPAEVARQSDYYALLKRRGQGEQFAVWHVDLRDPLPVIAVPLREPFPDTLLDLSAAVAEVYARGTYALRLDYAQPPPPPRLPPADLAWVTQQIAAWRGSQLESP
jgi:Protein of unknown function (DUF4058)